MGRELLPILVMVMVQVSFAGINILAKLAMNSGMSPLVMIAYRQIISNVFSLPFAYFWERKTWSKITWPVLFQIFLCSLFGATMNQNFYFMGLKYSTPTIACALNNMLPAVTFIIAVLLRMERVGLKKLGGQAKVIGTILCVGGAMVMTFYKGKLINMWKSNIHWRYAENLTHKNSANENIILGCILILGSCFAWAIWLIIQAKVSKNFKSPYTCSAIMCFMASIECVIVAACIERDISQWALGWNIRFVAAAYSGIVVSGISFSLMTWCIQRRGALFVSMFSPLLLIIVAVVGWGILDEKLHVGSVIGSTLIVIGLYAVLWGKGKEMNNISSINVTTLEKEDKEGGDIVLNISSINGKTLEEEDKEGGDIVLTTPQIVK